MMSGARRRWIAALMALFALSLLAACGSDGDSGDESGAASDNGDVTDSGTLTVWHYFDESAGGLFTAIEGWEKDFEKAHPDVDVKLQFVPYGRIVSKVAAASAAGEGPDLIILTGPFLPEMQRAGALEPLDEYWDAFAGKDQFPAAVQDVNRIDGELYAIQAYANIVAVQYNKDLLAKLKLEPPQSYEDLEAAMAKAKAEGYGAITTDATPGANGEFWGASWLVNAGWSYQDAGNEEAILEAFGRIEDWREKGYLSPNDATQSGETENMQSGKYLFSQDGNWTIEILKEAGIDFGILNFPGVDKAVLGGETFAVGGHSKNPELAWLFVEEMILSKEGAVDFAEAGSSPLRQDVLSEPEIRDNPLLAAYTEIASTSEAIPLGTNSGKVTQVMGDAYNQLVAGKYSAAEAAETITSQVPSLIAEGAE
jgi:multiple sugar transport system substrate-binding protein